VLNFSFIAKTGPGILILGGLLFMFLDQTAKTSFGIAGPALIGVGILVSLVWAGVFNKF